MQFSRSPDDDKVWTVRVHDDAEAHFIERLFTALANTYPDPPPVRVVPEAVLERISGTSNPEVSLEVVHRLNLNDDAQANLGQLYQWCEHAEDLGTLQSVVDELVSAKVVKTIYCVNDSEGHGIEHFDSRESIPSEMEDWDGNTFEVTDNDVTIVYVRDPEAFGAAE